MAQSRQDQQRAFNNDQREQGDRVAKGNNAENLHDRPNRAQTEIRRRADPKRPDAQRRH